MPQIDNSNTPETDWVEEQYRKEREHGIYRSPYNSQFDH